MLACSLGLVNADLLLVLGLGLVVKVLPLLASKLNLGSGIDPGEVLQLLLDLGLGLVIVKVLPLLALTLDLGAFVYPAKVLQLLLACVIGLVNA